RLAGKCFGRRSPRTSWNRRSSTMKNTREAHKEEAKKAVSLFHWLRRHTRKTASLEPWETITTAKIPQLVHDTRHYLDNSVYQLPKDAEEDVRINFQHHALFHAIGNHYLAPLSPPLPLILDVGTGTGIWAGDMARLFPTSTVVGI